MPFTVRRGTPADAATVAAFNIAMAKETEDIALDPAVVGPGVLAALSDPARSLYFVAEDGGRLLGQTMVTYEWSDWRNGNLWWIQSVYVAPDARERGVFKALHARVVEDARAAGAVGVRLYVFEENRRAQEVYRRLGMTDARYRVIEQMFDGTHGD
jgi:ribosomal protein S18 acetylase RimI-like enzyme